MVRGDDYRPLGWNMSQTANLGTKSQHQNWGQKCPQGSVRQVVEHGSNLVAIDDYDTI